MVDLGGQDASAWTQYYAGAQQQQSGFSQPGYAAAAQQHYPGVATGMHQQTTAQPQQQAQGGQGVPDYSAQWAEYYRSLGMHDQAQMVSGWTVDAGITS